MSDTSKSKKGRTTGKVLVIILLAVLAIVAAGGVVVVNYLNKINKVQPENEERISASEEDFEVEEEQNTDLPELSPEEVQLEEAARVSETQEQQVINLLLIGQDRRENQGRQRSDSMILCSVNTVTKKITLTSLMRDMYVQIPGYSDNRINAAYQFGGMGLLDEVVLTNFGVQVDGNIEVDFNGFTEIIDLVGGVDIELYQAEADYLNKGNGWSLTAGINHLNGAQALAYAGTRYVGHSDWERTDRQRKVLISVFNSLKDQGVGTLLNVFNTALPMLTTDISNTEMLGYFYKLATGGYTLGETHRLPAEGTYTEARIRGMEVLVPDLPENSQMLKSYIYGDGQ